MSHRFIIDQWNFNTTPATQVEPDEQLNIEQLGKMQKGHWYHCQRESPELRQWLVHNDLEIGIIDSLLADDTRPRFEQFEHDSFLLILRGVNLNQGSTPDDMLSLRILWHKGILLSTRKIPSKAIAQLRELLSQAKGPKDIQHALLAIVEGFNGNIVHFLDEVEERIFEIDEENQRNTELSTIHKRLLKLRRFMKPQRYALNDFLSAELAEMQSASVRLGNALDTIIRVNESIDFCIEQIQLIKAEIEQEQAEVMNRNTYLFTIIAVLFLPVGFLTGLLGVNVGGIPGTESPIAFALFCGILLITFVIEVFLLKKMRFF